MIQTGFTGFAFDRADHLRHDSEALTALASDFRARLMRLIGSDPVLDDFGHLEWGSLAELGEEDELILLGLEDGRPRFAPLGRPGAAGTRMPMNIVGDMAPQDAAAWGAARSLIDWHNRHRFCANCGSGTDLFRAGWGRKCRECRTEHFPRVDPVVIMLAEHDGRVLLGRQPGWPPGRYSALAGFVEPGESIEEAVARETFEEAGVRVANVRYIASQPWPFPGQLMIACMAEAQGDEITLDPNELQDAIWVDRAGVAASLRGDPNAPFLPPPGFAIAYTLLSQWAN